MSQRRDAPKEPHRLRTCNLFGIALAEEHLDGSCDMFPLADNTIKGLRAVFLVACILSLLRGSLSC